LEKRWQWSARPAFFSLRSAYYAILPTKISSEHNIVTQCTASHLCNMVQKHSKR
jgi:hypothetical protein